MADAPVDIVDRTPKFTAQDRCDTCRAQAWASATVNGTILLFCMHHYRRAEDRLILTATNITVDRAGFENSAQP